MQRLAIQAVHHQAVAGLQRRKRHQRVAVLDEGQVVVGAEDLGDAYRHDLVELQRVRGADEIGARQEKRVERRVGLDRGLHVDDVQHPVRQRLERELVGNHPEVGPRDRCQVAALGAQRGVELDDEIEHVEIVLQEHVVAQIGEADGPQREAVHLDRPGIRLDEGQDLGADVEMAQDQRVGLGRGEGLEAPIDELMQRAVEVGPVRRDHAQQLHQQEEAHDEGAGDWKYPAPGKGAVAEQQRPLGAVVDRQALIEVERQPGIRVARVEACGIEDVAARGHWAISSI